MRGVKKVARRATFLSLHSLAGRLAAPASRPLARVRIVFREAENDPPPGQSPGIRLTRGGAAAPPNLPGGFAWCRLIPCGCGLILLLLCGGASAPPSLPGDFAWCGLIPCGCGLILLLLYGGASAPPSLPGGFAWGGVCCWMGRLYTLFTPCSGFSGIIPSYQHERKEGQHD